MSSFWTILRGDEPIVATAIHDGHELRDEVAQRMALSESERLREEDPYSGRWTGIAANRVVPRVSRFEVDLNRPRDRAVYERPEDAWGLALWTGDPPAELLERSLAIYDAFYAEMGELLGSLVRRFGRVVVLDLHTYNHRRHGADGPGADPAANPEVNIGTGTLDRVRWGRLADRFIADLRSYDFRGRRLEVGENVKFRGGHFSRWTHETFPGSVCTLAVEFKKFFMDEWTGELDEGLHAEIARALASTLPGLRAALDAMRSK